MNDQELNVLRRMEAAAIAESEMRQLGHRIVFDQKTGWSKNIFGCHVDPSCLDENGLRTRYA